MDLIRLIYASKAQPAIEFSALREILFTAEANNAAQQITGALAYGHGSFLQLLEGEKEAVNKLFAAIAGDPRHSDPVIIEISPITARDFPDWSMRYARFDEHRDSRHRKLVKSITDSDEFTPRNWSGAQCRNLLLELTETGSSSSTTSPSELR